MRYPKVLTREQIQSNALEVTDQLQQAGFEALLVGGCVRDLLLDLAPKDFDVATNATPEEVRGVFRRARMVGRRFRIVHVRFGREIIEVSTFRKAAEDAAGVEVVDPDRVEDAAGILLRDNVFGSLEEDAFRRDFTINALYFDPTTEEVIDYVNGLTDLEERRLRLIGEPNKRFTEDPVRLLRAIRFQAKLDFELEPTMAAEIPNVVELLDAMPAARLFDEVSKMFLGGYARDAWTHLCRQGVNRSLFPCTPTEDPLVELAMDNTDARLAEQKGVTPGFLFAVLLWRDFCAIKTDLSAEHKPYEAAMLAADTTFRNQNHITSVPRRISQFAKETWLLQDRMIERTARHIPRLLNQQRFRAAYDFLLLRADSGESELLEAAEWWTKFQDADRTEQEAMRQALRPGTKPKRRRRRKGQKKGATHEQAG